MARIIANMHFVADFGILNHSVAMRPREGTIRSQQALALLLKITAVVQRRRM